MDRAVILGQLVLPRLGRFAGKDIGLEGVEETRASWVKGIVVAARFKRKIDPFQEHFLKIAALLAKGGKKGMTLFEWCVRHRAATNQPAPQQPARLLDVTPVLPTG